MPPHAPTSPPPPPWAPKYLDEPDIPVRRLAYWLRRDVASWSEGVRRMRMPEVAAKFQPILERMLESRDPKEQRAAMRTFLRLNELELREFGMLLEHTAKLVESNAAEAIMAAQAAKMQGHGVTPDAMRLQFDEVARIVAQQAAATGEPGGAGGG